MNILIFQFFNFLPQIFLLIFGKLYYFFFDLIFSINLTIHFINSLLKSFDLLIFFLELCLVLLLFQYLFIFHKLNNFLTFFFQLKSLHLNLPGLRLVQMRKTLQLLLHDLKISLIKFIHIVLVLLDLFLQPIG